MHLLRHQSAIIHSPTNGLHYPPATLCNWNVTTQPLLWLRINIERFSLEMSQNCSKDYVDVSGLGRRCGMGDLGSYVIKRSFIDMTFATDFDTEEEGFQISVVSVGKKNAFM